MAAKRIRTIPVHALDDDRVHLAPARPGHLRQGRLETLCGKLAVTALSPFAGVPLAGAGGADEGAIKLYGGKRCLADRDCTTHDIRMTPEQRSKPVAWRRPPRD